MMKGWLPQTWSVVHRTQIPKRRSEVFPFDKLPISEAARSFLDEEFSGGLYRHQMDAIRENLAGSNVCMTTRTASGKSLPFYVAGMEVLREGGKVLAIYPLRALGQQEQERWEQVLSCSTLGSLHSVGRIDGSIPRSKRTQVLKNSSILIGTPDILHAWLLPSVGETAVQDFLRELKLIVVDEVHNYTGVFGSNASFLFRRLQHLMVLLGNHDPNFMCASATINNPEEHLYSLFGQRFSLIGQDRDTSPRHEVTIEMVRPPRSENVLTAVSDLLAGLASEEPGRFLAFVDSRKQAELIAAIVRRVTEDSNGNDVSDDLLRSLDVLPFRAGYEERDRNLILQRLREGSLRGVVSTSALELGMDIAHLSTGVLVGVPYSSTSMWQRIGRIGRKGPGRIVVLGTGDIHDERAFRKPKELLNRPPAEGALYLKNQRIQYIHTLCLARERDGEHDSVMAPAKKTSPDFESPIEWPSGFLQLCEAERTGEIPVELQSMKTEGGDVPHLVYPLRDTDSQFEVQLRRGPDRHRLGNISYDQAMREAYPGAVYYYASSPYRVIQVRPVSRQISVKAERSYTTSPIRLPTLVYPNLSGENIRDAFRIGRVTVIDCAMQVRKVILGYSERRGPNEFKVEYPCDVYHRSSFSRNYFTTGVVISHESINGAGVDRQQLASLLYEALLVVTPFERQDLGYADDTFRIDRGPVCQDDRFITIFDQTYGSLCLSSRLTSDDIFRQVIGEAKELAVNDDTLEISTSTLACLDALAAEMNEAYQSLRISDAAATAESSGEEVIKPGSKGWAVNKNNAVFVVEDVFFRPDGLHYRGYHEETRSQQQDVSTVWPVDLVRPIPGETEMALYDFDRGQVVSLE